MVLVAVALFLFLVLFCILRARVCRLEKEIGNANSNVKDLLDVVRRLKEFVGKMARWIRRPQPENLDVDRESGWKL